MAMFVSDGSNMLAWHLPDGDKLLSFGQPPTLGWLSISPKNDLLLG